jgi:signal transduction histidine kinase
LATRLKASFIIDMKKDEDKLESIRVLAHDLNNILSPLLGYTELSLEGVDPDSNTAKNLEQIYKVTNRARDVVKEILDLSKEDDQ